jgi:hypothetical protein
LYPLTYPYHGRPHHRHHHRSDPYKEGIVIYPLIQPIPQLLSQEDPHVSESWQSRETCIDTIGIVTVSKRYGILPPLVVSMSLAY